ncbi:MAG: aspartate kinase [Armatimonadota bacterium]
MKVVVQKFGGTCVESEANQLITAERIMEARDRNLHPVVVVSAMGREGQPYSTVELVNAARRIDPDIAPRELDLIMSCGEIISTAAMAHLLKTKGYDTIALTGGQAGLITDEFFGHARIVRIEPRQLLAALQEGLMVFVAGFQGNTNDHQITTLGAGGSDYTAVALTHVINDTPQLPFGEELETEPLQIFKEVDGIMTANPKSLEEGSAPRALPHLTYDECVVMSRLGAEVIQHQAAEMARKYRIPLAVRNFLVADGAGTRVSAETESPDESRPTAIVDQPGLLVFDLGSEDARLLLQIAERLERERLTFFQVIANGRTRFAVRPLKYRRVETIVRQVLLSRGVNADISAGEFALVSVVGEALRGRLDRWQEKAERALADSRVQVHGGAIDQISVSLLVPGDQRKRAVTGLHKALVL